MFAQEGFTSTAIETFVTLQYRQLGWFRYMRLRMESEAYGTAGIGDDSIAF